MRIKRARLEQIIREEFAKRIERALKEAPLVADAHDDKKSKEKDGGKGERKKVSPSSGPETPGNTAKADTGKKPGEEPKVSNKEPAKGSAPAKGEEAPEQELDAEPADAKLDKADDAESDEPKSKGEGDVSDEIVGKSVQSITMEPKSKVLPGAVEVVITFDQTPDPLRILIPKSGVPKFYYRGLHNEL